MMTPSWFIICVALVIHLTTAAEKASSGGKDGKSKLAASADSRNGDLLTDQLAEESRIAEVEAAEKSYANSGPAPPPLLKPPGPPPIPVPVPVQVRPGALVLPSPGNSRNGGNQVGGGGGGGGVGGGGVVGGGSGGGHYQPSSFVKHHQDMAYDNPQAQASNFQDQALALHQGGNPNVGNGGGVTGLVEQPPSIHRGPPAPLHPQQHGGPQQPPPQPGGHPPPAFAQQQQHPNPNVPPNAKQNFPQPQPGPAKHQSQQLLAQLHGLLPQLGLPHGPQPGSQPSLDSNHLFEGALLQAQQQQQQQQQQQHLLQLKGPQKKANNNVELSGQPSQPIPHFGEMGVAVVPDGSGHFPGFQQFADDSWPQQAPSLPQIVHLEAKCEKNHMKVAIKFDKPFYGVVFSKGNYDNEACVHVRPGQGHTSSTFSIAINGCGTTGNTQNGLYGFGEQTGSGSFFENTIIVQYDPLVQEMWDQARKLRCSWHDFYEKSVIFKPFNVEMLDIVHTDFAGDNVGCWMQIQAGIGPWASEVSGIVKIGQRLTMVLAIKDEENKFDMLVRDCVAHDGRRAPVELVDDRGCVMRPMLMSKFTKIKGFDASASVLSYAHFQAFKFPDSMDVHFQCTIQICRHQCPEQCAPHIDGPARSGDGLVTDTLLKPATYIQGGRPRLERALLRALRSTGNLEDAAESDDVEDSSAEKGIGVNGNIKVVSTGDLAFSLDSGNVGANASTTMVYPFSPETSGLICISTPSFAVTLIFLLSVLVISCIVSTFLCLRSRTETSSAESTCSSSTDHHSYKPRATLYGFLRRGKY